MAEPAKPKSMLERFNSRSSTLITFFTNLKVLLVAAVIAFGVGMMSEGGRATIKRMYCQLGGFGVECVEYVPVQNRFDPAVMVVQEAVKADTGIDADFTEFSVHVLADDQKNLRWEGDGQRRTYHVENQDGVWVYILISED